jgi:phosphatidylserine decarboxylase
METLLFQESLNIVLVIFILLLIFRNYNYIFLLLTIVLLMLIGFYRLPNRIPNKFPKKIILSPCDGKILSIKKTEAHYKISIYLNIFDVHVQWFPTHGIIRKIKYKKGTFNLAHLLEKSEYNEKITTIIQNEYGFVRIDQIAGQLARRIVTWKLTNTEVNRGDLLGMIKLSSRVDLYLPKSKVKLFISEKDNVIGNITPIATWIT